MYQVLVFPTLGPSLPLAIRTVSAENRSMLCRRWVSIDFIVSLLTVLFDKHVKHGRYFVGADRPQLLVVGGGSRANRGQNHGAPKGLAFARAALALRVQYHTAHYTRYP